MEKAWALTPAKDTETSSAAPATVTGLEQLLHTSPVIDIETWLGLNPPIGLHWEVMGTVPPAVGDQIKHTGLQRALQYVTAKWKPSKWKPS